MKYSLTNTIHKPLEEVVEKFKDEEGLKHWMEGFQKVVRVSGDPHSAGAKSEFHFLYKNKEMVIKETILESDLPKKIKFAYESSMGNNEVEMQFERLSDNSVKQINHTHFHLKGFMKVMGFLFKGMFKKQSLKYMDGFKNYVETGASVLN